MKNVKNTINNYMKRIKSLEALYEEMVMPKQEFKMPDGVEKPKELNSQGKEGKDDIEPKEIKFVIREQKDYDTIFSTIWKKSASEREHLSEGRQKAMKDGAKLFWDAVFRV
jgi:hypothetical protein